MLWCAADKQAPFLCFKVFQLLTFMKCFSTVSAAQIQRQAGWPRKKDIHTHHLSLGSIIHSVMDLLYFCANFACFFLRRYTCVICILRSKKKIHHPFCGFSLMFTSLWKLMHVLNFSPSSAIYTGVMHVKIGILKIGLSVKWETSRAQVSVKSIAIDGIYCLEEKYRPQFSTVLSSGVFPFCLTSSLE